MLMRPSTGLDISRSRAISEVGINRVSALSRTAKFPGSDTDRHSAEGRGHDPPAAQAIAALIEAVLSIG